MPNCQHCGIRPVWGNHPYCGKTCANNAKNAGGGSSPRPKGMEENGGPNCILCQEYPKSNGHFCGKQCADRATQQAPTILHIPITDPKFNEIVGQFNESWRHKQYPKPNVRRIYKIIQSDTLMQRYYAYRESVEEDGDFKQRRMQPGNERRRWHGTRRGCTLGDDPRKTKLCDGKCGVCGIIRTSFKLTMVATARTSKWERYGRGIYASSTSSKSHDYAKENQTVPSPYLSMLLTTVAAGEGYKTTDNGETLSKPPSGYHCVLGEVGDKLNYDEIVVYDEDAIRPAWLIIYDK